MTNTMTAKQSLPIYITDQDKNRLEKMIAGIKSNPMRRDDFSLLASELDRATTVDSGRMPRNVVTMNSRVAIIDQDTSERLIFTLVFPEDADAEENKISVLAPVGAGMLGYRVGDEFEWIVPAGKRRFIIAKVLHQPDAKKNFRL
jgi:regulator of nucleoside diphosphate kinase